MEIERRWGGNGRQSKGRQQNFNNGTKLGERSWRKKFEGEIDLEILCDYMSYTHCQIWRGRGWERGDGVGEMEN